MVAYNKKNRSPMVLVLVLGIDRVLLSVEERSCLERIMEARVRKYRLENEGQ